MSAYEKEGDNSMTFQQLQYLLEVYRTGSVSQAARNLFVAQSSVSTSVGNLERELDCSIFIRSKQGLIPTTQGMEIIEHANRICESHHLMTISSKPHITNVRITSNNFTPAHNAFFRLVNENKHRNDVIFSMTSGGTSATKLLKFFNLELSIKLLFAPSFHSTQAYLVKEGLQCKLLGSVPAAIRIGENHRLYQEKNIVFSDLSEDFLLDVPGKEISKVLSKAGITQIDSKKLIITNHAPLRDRLLREGMAYAIGHMLPEYSVPKNGIRYIPLDGLSYKLCVVSNPLHPNTPELERFLELLNEELSTCGVLMQS